MQKILIVASCFFAILPSCKKSSSSSSPSKPVTAAAPTNTGCPPPNLALLNTTPPPPNVDPSKINLLNLDFRVQSALDTKGASKFLLNINPIPAPALGDRVADFPRVNICELTKNNCVTFDFPFWSGIVRIPKKLEGKTFQFKASACTYIREQDPQSNLWVPTSKYRCSKLRAADPKVIGRSSQEPTSEALQIQEVQKDIIGLADYLLPFAVNYEKSLAGVTPTEDSKKILDGLAKSIIREPKSVGAFLASDVYRDAYETVVKEAKSGGALHLADSGCPVISPSTVTVTNTTPGEINTVIQTVAGATTTVVKSSTTTLNTVTTHTITQIANPTAQRLALMNYKLRVLDSTGKVAGCMLYGTATSVSMGLCSDANKSIWDINPVASNGSAFQIVSKVDGRCMAQATAKAALTMSDCDPTKADQYFQFTPSTTLLEAPMVGNATSSTPYQLYAMQGTATNCINSTATSFSIGTSSTCSTFYSMDSIPEPIAIGGQIGQQLGTSAKNGNTAIFEIAGMAGGLVLGIIGLGYAIPGETSNDYWMRKVEQYNKLPGTVTKLPTTVGSDGKLPSTVIDKLRPQVDSGVLRDNPADHWARLKTKEKVGFVSGVIGILGAIGTGAAYGIGNYALATTSNPELAFAQALVNANKQFILLRDLLNTLQDTNN